MTSPLDDLTGDELDEMQWIVGRIICNLPRTSLYMGHEKPEYTITGNYLCPTDGDPKPNRAAKEFVKDLFTMTTEQFCKKWHCDEWPQKSVLVSMVPAPKRRAAEKRTKATHNFAREVIERVRCGECGCIQGSDERTSHYSYCSKSCA